MDSKGKEWNGSTEGLKMPDSWDMWGTEMREALIAGFKSQLSTYRDAELEAEQRGIARTKVLGINWEGVQLFLTLTNLFDCSTNMGWVIENVVKPMCSQEKCQLIEFFLGIRVKGMPCIGAANWFHSYTWAETVNDTFRTLRSNLYQDKRVQDAYFWWDMFCQNQHIVGNVQKTFDSSIEQIGCLVISIPLPSKPIAATRIWCIFELMSAIIKGKDIRVFCDPTNEKLSKSDTVKVDVRNSQATVSTDKTMILSLIQKRVKGGVNEVNLTVAKKLRAGLIQAEMIRDLASQAGNIGSDEFDGSHLDMHEIRQAIYAQVGINDEVQQMFRKEQLLEYAKSRGVKLPKPKIKEPQDVKPAARMIMQKKKAAVMRFGKADALGDADLLFPRR